MTEAELTSEDGCVTGEEEGCEKMKPEDFCEEGDEEEEFEADPCVEPAASEPGPVHALVPVTQATADTTLKLRNSTTNKKEYDTFCRQIRSSGKFPVSLSDYCQTNRLDLFNVWLDNGGDWDATKVQVERTQSQKNSTVNGWRAVQGKELRPKYTPEKFAQLVASRRAAGLFYKDDDFPDDEDECWFFMRSVQEVKQKTETAEKMRLKASKEVNADLRSFCLGQQSSHEVAAAPKKAPKQKAEKILASSWAGQAKERQETLLQDAAKARTSSIALGSIEYASELSKQLLEHATKLENFYKKIDQAIQQDASEGAFKAIMIKIREGDAFGEKAKAAAQAFLRTAKAKGKAKAKPKAKGSAIGAAPAESSKPGGSQQDAANTN
ncbi:unnamed protein product [Cladocopium goreaui]|uniref:Uncharacterized protein n=1 Tax=Cladocopium goreaui TaxID=2562237 RepID=A0A9P1BRM7_9DINO|nr:unnamed protein product [Cladocopium goreaui]